jgi:ABC-type nitrate/sulfonate/bicarbonate transport systems, periplasmic components
VTKFPIATAPGDTYFLDAVDKSQGLYEGHHLDVPKFIYPTSGVQGMQLLSGGTINGGAQDMLLTIEAFAHSRPGERPVVVGVRYPEPINSIVVAKGHNWPAQDASFKEKMASLRGKRVGVTAIGAGADLQLRLALSAAGMSNDDVTHLAVGQATPAIAQMQGGRIDAYVGISYVTSRMMVSEAGGRIMVDFTDAEVPNVLNKQVVYAICVREKFAQTNRAAAQNWLAAQWAAKTWITEHQAAAAKELNTGSFNGKAASESTAFVKHFTDVLVPKMNPMFGVTRESIDRMIAIAERLGLVKTGSVTFERLVPDFARAT